MPTLTATEARKRLYSLVDEVKESHEPVQIVGKRSSAVLISEEDWRAIQETLFLTSIPGMRESIQEGLRTPVEECDEILTGDLENSLYQTSKERRQENCTFRFETSSRAYYRDSKEEPPPDSTSI